LVTVFADDDGRVDQISLGPAGGEQGIDQCLVRVTAVDRDLPDESRQCVELRVEALKARRISAGRAPLNRLLAAILLRAFQTPVRCSTSWKLYQRMVPALTAGRRTRVHRGRCVSWAILRAVADQPDITRFESDPARLSFRSAHIKL
jgi:hypothetical protein